MRFNSNGTNPLALDPTEVARTLAPVERASMLPPAAFADPSVVEWELATIFRGWVCVGHVSAVDEPGKFMTREVGPDSVVVIAAEDGTPHAFLNVCRHRGSRIVLEREGQVRRRLRCPYHAWSYGLDGSLRAAPHMDGVEDFDFSCWGLMPVRLAVVAGLILIDLSGEAEEIDEHVGELRAHLDHYRVDSLDLGARREYVVDANWKGIAENYNECLHCPGVHPELNAISDYMSGEEVEGDGAWCGGSMTLTEGAETMGKEGGHGSRPPISSLEDADLRNILYFALFPNLLVSLHPDYVMVHTLWPRGAGRTEVVCEWYFEPETIAQPGFDPADAVDFWDTVNRQDWHVCELAQRGVGSRGYRAGRYTAVEHTVHAFDQLVAEAYLTP